MTSNAYNNLIKRDAKNVWHPYSAFNAQSPIYPVASADGVMLTLADGQQLIDGMSSWWCAIHGYNHPVLNQAITEQLQSMSHVMFGGLTHQPAIDLAELLVAITPEPLQAVFFSDSGSVAVEVAMKMAIQYCYAKGHSDKRQFLTLKGGYHGDTFATMSVCDPDNGMHILFSDLLMPQFFVDSPACIFAESCKDADLEQMRQLLDEHHQSIAAIILEPIVQGAGGMWFYSADYLKQVRELADHYDVLLIADEIATGFGRSGKLFACEHANIAPDIMCLGKSLTGGYMTLAATLTTQLISHTISNAEPGVFMHGPTFMANPLACSVALASTRLLLASQWQQQIAKIEATLIAKLACCKTLEKVRDVRVLGAIGVVELHEQVDIAHIQQQFVDAGVWIRPFGRLVYLMPPFIIETDDLESLCQAIYNVLKQGQV